MKYSASYTQKNITQSILTQLYLNTYTMETIWHSVKANVLPKDGEQMLGCFIIRHYTGEEWQEDVGYELVFYDSSTGEFIDGDFNEIIIDFWTELPKCPLF